MELIGLFNAYYSQIVVLLVMGVAVAFGVRDWCMRHHVAFHEYPHSFLLPAWMLRFYVMLLVIYVVFPGIDEHIRLFTNRGIFILFLVGLVHACRGPLEWYAKHVVLVRLMKFRRGEGAIRE